MKQRVVITLAAVALLAGLTFPGNAQKKGKTRPMTTSQLMAGLVKPEFGELKAALEKGPSTEEEWKAVGIQAALLNESAHLMMADGRCPDEIWKNGCEILEASTLELLKNIEAKNSQAAATGAEKIVQSCKVCHAEHKYKKK